MQNYIFLVGIALLLPSKNWGQTNKTFFLGHSLVNFHTPNMVKRLADQANENFIYKANIGIGASLSWHYNSPQTGQGDAWNTTLPEGGFENFLLTEALALKPNILWNDTHGYTDMFFQYAQTYSPNIKLYVYETWHCIYSGTGTGCQGWWDSDTLLPFRTRLIQDLPLWESIADSINAQYGTNTAFVVPAGQALLALNDSISAGLVPGIASINELFVDNIHTSFRGAYFIACVMYASLIKKSPEGLPHALLDPDGVPYAINPNEPNPIPTPAQAAIFQRIAWQTVSNYPKSGINAPSSQTENLAGTGTNFTVFPNPVSDVVRVRSNLMSEINRLCIRNQYGQICSEFIHSNSSSVEVNVANLPPGIYSIEIENEGTVETKLFIKG